MFRGLELNLDFSHDVCHIPKSIAFAHAANLSLDKTVVWKYRPTQKLGGFLVCVWHLIAVKSDMVTTLIAHAVFDDLRRVINIVDEDLYCSVGAGESYYKNSCCARHGF